MAARLGHRQLDGDVVHPTPPPSGDGIDVIDVEERFELAPLPPDPLLVTEPIGQEPPWLTGGLEGTELWGDQDEAVPPDHLPSDLLATIDPGLFLATELEGTEPREVDEYHLVELIAGYQRMASFAHYRMTELAGRLSRRPALNPQGWRPDGDYVINATAQELAPRLGISRFAAQRMVDNAEMFRIKLEDTGTALQLGRIDNAKACAIARLLKDQPDYVAWEVQQMVLPDASHQTITQLERAVSKAIISIDPLRATARHKRAREQRRVNHLRPLPDGMASLSAILPATDAAGLDLALDAAARSAKAAGDTRTIDQLRADALALLGHGALEQGFIGVRNESCHTDAAAADQAATAPAHETPDDAAAAPAADAAEDPPSAAEPPVMHTGNAFLRTPCMPIGAIGGRRAQIKVTVPLSVLIAAETLDDHDHPPSGDSPAHSQAPAPLQEQRPGTPPGRSSPGNDEPPDDDGLPEDWYHGPPVEVAELDGYGPITPDVARALAHSGGTWQRLVTDPLSGALLDVGRSRYRPPAPIADFVRNRDGTCVRPGCSAPADSCQLDHIVPWEFGGVTSADNVGPHCTSDHAVKTAGGCQLRHLGGGRFEWTSATGHHYLRDHTGRITALGRRTLAADPAHGPAPFSAEPPY